MVIRSYAQIEVIFELFERGKRNNLIRFPSETISLFYPFIYYDLSWCYK